MCTSSTHAELGTRRTALSRWCSLPPLTRCTTAAVVHRRYSRRCTNPLSQVVVRALLQGGWSLSSPFFFCFFCSMNANGHRGKNASGGRRSFGWVVSCAVHHHQPFSPCFSTARSGAPTNGRPGFPFVFLGAGGRLPKARRGRAFGVIHHHHQQQGVRHFERNGLAVDPRAPCQTGALASARQRRENPAGNHGGVAWWRDMKGRKLGI